jgi:hypothetical protein
MINLKKGQDSPSLSEKFKKKFERSLPCRHHRTRFKRCAVGTLGSADADDVA